MQKALIESICRTRTLSIVGMCKNAGKTTVLNWLLGQSRGRVLGLTSIGRDGESTDIVTGTEKPGIFLSEGTLFATAKDMLSLCDVTQEIMDTTGIPTGPFIATSIWKTAASRRSMRTATATVTDTPTPRPRR